MWLLSKFMFRRDKFQLLLWVAGLVLINVAVAAAFNEMFASPEELMGMVMTLENPAMIAMLGPLYANTVAAVYTQNMLVFVAMTVAVMNIFMVTRHTRFDEEEGRLEVLRSLPVGRTWVLKAVLLNGAIVNSVIALFTGIGLALVGLESGAVTSGITDTNGAFLYGALLGVTGLMFAAFTALFAQLSANNRTVLSYVFGFLGITYLLRAMGDMNAEILALISPLGFIFRAEPFVGNHWWPVILGIVLSILVSLLALLLNNRRDLGAGFLPEKAGRAHGGRLLKTPFGLSIKLSKGSLIGWAITLFILGASYGSIFGDIDAFITSNDIFAQIFYGTPTDELAFAFMSFIIVMMGAVVAVPVVGIVLKLKAEERKNRVEHLLARQVSRVSLLAGYVKIAAVSAVFLLFFLGFGLYIASSAVMDEPIRLTMILTAVMVYLPALWIFLGVATLLVGVFPKYTSLAWAYLGYGFIVVYLGQLLSLPTWTSHTTPLGFIPNYPVEEISILTLITLTVIAMILVGIGLFGYRKRDVTG